MRSTLALVAALLVGAVNISAAAEPVRGNLQGRAPIALERSEGASARRATAVARLSSIRAAHVPEGTYESGVMNMDASVAHAAAAKVNDGAGRTKRAEEHRERSLAHRETASSSLHVAASAQAAKVEASSLHGAAPAKRVWVDRQFSGYSDQTVGDHFVHDKPLGARAAFQERALIGPAFEGKHTAAQLGQKPVAILTMGGPASGKSTLLKTLVQKGVVGSDFVIIDPDAIKTKLPEYRAEVPETGGKTFAGAASQVHEESKYVQTVMQKRAIDGGYHVVIDGTGSHPDFIPMIESLKAKGYDVQVHHADIPVNVAVERAAARAEASGRRVPESVIRSAYAAIAKEQPKIEAAAPTYVRYDMTK